MNIGRQLQIALVAGAVFTAALAALAHCRADEHDTNNQLTLADLAAYQAALSGKPTAEGARTADPPRRVRFRDIWDQPESFRGRRVIVQGRVERIFRQAAVGSFPPLAEVWITSPAGDPFCAVFPPKEPNTGDDQQHGTMRRDRTSSSLNRRDAAPLAPGVGRTVRFTGTFLKMVSYTASDGKRLAPLIVGDRPPFSKSDRPEGDDATRLGENAADVFRSIGGSNSRVTHDRWPWSPASWAMALTLAVLATGIITWQHLRAPVQRRRSVQQSRFLPGDDEPPLEFISSQDDP